MLVLEVEAERLALGAAVAATDALGSAEVAVSGELAEAATVALGSGTLATVPAKGADDITGEAAALGTVLGDALDTATEGNGATDDWTGGNELANSVAEPATTFEGSPCPSSAAAAHRVLPSPTMSAIKLHLGGVVSM